MKLFLKPVLLSQRSIAACIVAILALLLFAQPAQAHPAPFSYLDLHLEEQAIDGSLTVHVIDLAHELDLDEPTILLDQSVLDQQYSEITRILSQRFSIGGGALPDPQWGSYTRIDDDDAIRLSFSIAAPPPAELQVSAQMFPYDDVHQTFVNIWEDEEVRQQWILAGEPEMRTHFAGTTAGAMAVLTTFIPSGVHHIMIGPDHILFILGLILLGGSWRRLALIVTSFTIGHSVTLSLAAMQILVIPAQIIEPLIALSIVVVGVDNLLRGEGRDMRAILAFVFGLIHGFGFAFVLRDFGLPDGQMALSLFAFNLGVEIGQLVIVIAAGLILHLIRKRSKKLARHIATIGSLAVIAAGAYWFVDRVFL